MPVGMKHLLPAFLAWICASRWRREVMRSRAALLLLPPDMPKAEGMAVILCLGFCTFHATYALLPMPCYGG